MQRKKKKQWLFTKKDSSTGIAKSEPHTQTTIPLCKWYQNINELPLKRFIDCICDSNIYALIITGHPKMEELEHSWNEIKLQYADLIKDHEYRHYINQVNEHSRLEITYQQVLSLLAFLKDNYHKKFADMLNQKLGSSFQFNVNLPEDYDKDLKRAKTRSGGLKIQVDLKALQLAGLEKRFGENNDGKKMTRESFQSVLIALSDHKQYRITDDITVYEYCIRVQNLNREVEQMKLKRK